jgi:hypothetical protein
MPTPFYHIYAAHRLISRRILPGDIQQILEEHRPAFFLGSTAGDVQTVSGQKRIETHFYRLPYEGFPPFPWDIMFAKYPSISKGRSMEAEQFAFVAGYLCHLQADWLWTMEIFLPNFDGASNWAPFLQRMHLHNVLRAYVDEKIHDSLPSDVGKCLEAVEPQEWIPFITRQHLVAWRDLIEEQFRPGSYSKTVEVFAQRQGSSPQEFHRLLNSESLMDENIFKHFPRRRLEAYEEGLFSANVYLLSNWGRR